MNGGGSLAESYAWCERVARHRARNFYYSFLLLDKLRRQAMCAVYAFMRICDDLSDEPGAKSAQRFDEWRAETDAALAGRFSGRELWPAFHDTVSRYRIPGKYFHEMIDGVRSDIDFQRIETFDQLYRYCYCVASVVGLTVIHVLGYRTPDALPLAEKCGVAFQLTNILRDVKEDFQNGRIYLPSEDMARFAVTERDLAETRVCPRLRDLLAFEAQRARAYYRDSQPLVGMVEPSGRAMLRALIETYSRLLRRIERRGYEVLDRRVSLSRAEKLWVLVKAATVSSPSRMTAR